MGCNKIKIIALKWLNYIIIIKTFIGATYFINLHKHISSRYMYIIYIDGKY